MAAKTNNKMLLIMLAALIVLFIVIRIFRSQRYESTMGSNLIEKIDTAKVSEIRLFPSSEQGKEIRFIREGNSWMVERDKLRTEAEINSVKALLSEMTNLKIDQLIAKGKERWKENNVDDTTGTKIKIYEGKKEMLDMVVGKFNYKPSNNPYQQQYGGGGGFNGNTCVRIGSDKDVYAVPGFLGYAVNQPFNNWRNQNYVRIEKEAITKITFRYPADSSFTLEKRDTLWYLNNTLTDKKLVDDYLNKISYKSNSSFIDDFIVSGAPIYTLVIEGNNMAAITLSAYKRGENDYVLHSSQNPKNYFGSMSSGLLSEVFVKKESF